MDVISTGEWKGEWKICHCKCHSAQRRSICMLSDAFRNKMQMAIMLTDFKIWIFVIIYTRYGRRQWHPTPVLLPGKSHGQRSLVGCSPWGHQESNTTERLHFHFSLSCIGEGNGNPLQCSCLENPRDGGAWWAAFSGVAQSDTTEGTQQQQSLLMGYTNQVFLKVLCLLQQSGSKEFFVSCCEETGSAQKQKVIFVHYSVYFSRFYFFNFQIFITSLPFCLSLLLLY